MDQEREQVYKLHSGVVSRRAPCDSAARNQSPGGGALRSVARNLDDVQRRYPPLTAEEEREMIARHAGDRERLNELLVLHNVGFARSYVRRYGDRTEDAEDMWMRGLHGLSMAARAFDPSRGRRFCTLAGRYIQRAMRDLFDPMLSGPRTQSATEAVLDGPRYDSEDDTTMGDYYAAKAAPGWEPAWPAADRKRMEAEWADELAGYLAGRFGRTARERAAIRARLDGRTYGQIARGVMGGCSAETAKSAVRRLMKRIHDAVNRLDEKDELRGVLNK